MKLIAIISGVRVYADPTVAPGTVEFRDLEAKLIGKIVNVTGVFLGEDRDCTMPAVKR
jgi:hypothetical protein